jgi:F-type H+-transporting ATPase subunit b
MSVPEVAQAVAQGLGQVRVPPALEVNPVIPPLPEIIVGTIAFSILFAVLWRAVVPQFEKTFAERTAAIEGGMEQAEKTQAEADAALAEYKAQLAGARDEAAQIRATAQADRQQILAEARAEAEDVARQVTEQASARMQAEAAQVRAGLSREVGRLATTLAEKIVGENLDNERTRSTVDRFIAELERAAAVDGAPAGGGGG